MLMMKTATQVYDFRNTEYYRTKIPHKKEIKNPWTFLVFLSSTDPKFSIMTSYPPFIGNTSVCGYASPEEAEARRRELLQADEDQDYVYLVRQKADFVDGRGPMLPCKIFANIVKAENYIANQPGIRGSQQYHNIRWGINVLQELHAHIERNGYDIMKMKVE